MLQTLSDPLFAVPFLGALAAGGLGVALGAGYAWLMDRRAESRLDRLSARVGGVGLSGIGAAIVAFGFDYAATIAQLVRGSGPELSLWGRIGLALPWELIAGIVGVAALGCVFASMGLSVYAGWFQSNTAN